jgi:hypothetical protein
MLLFSAMLIGVVGTILIEAYLRKERKDAIRVPVQSDDHPAYRRYENYRR